MAAQMFKSSVCSLRTTGFGYALVRLAASSSRPSGLNSKFSNSTITAKILIVRNISTYKTPPQKIWMMPFCLCKITHFSVNLWKLCQEHLFWETPQRLADNLKQLSHSLFFVCVCVCFLMPLALLVPLKWRSQTRQTHVVLPHLLQLSPLDSTWTCATNVTSSTLISLKL